jgi:hypothetical protein
MPGPKPKPRPLPPIPHHRRAELEIQPDILERDFLGDAVSFGDFERRELGSFDDMDELERRGFVSIFFSSPSHLHTIPCARKMNPTY